MKEKKYIYLNGDWVAPAGTETIPVINPCNEEPIAQVALGNKEDVDRAVRYARDAFPSWSRTPIRERMEYISKISKAMASRQNEIGDTIALEMGMPAAWSRLIQVGLPIATLDSFIPILESYEFEYSMGTTLVVKEAIGVCGFITPWNYPMHQIIGKVAPALAAGCTMVVKPSQLAPLNSYILAEIMDEVGLPPGVFNLVVGAGSEVGHAIASHRDIDMVSLTGSTRSGVLVAQAAAETIKRVTLELGGKSPNIILEDADITTAVLKGVFNCFLNSGQTCISLSRMIVPSHMHKEIVELAKSTVESLKMGDAFEEGVYLGPMVDAQQQESVREYIRSGIREGATLVTGGPEQPESLKKGYFVKPTIFADVTPEMTIAQEEIFGPVLCIMPYRSEDEAVEIANNSIYGLSGSVWSGDPDRARRVARRIRSGQVFINGSDFDINAPAGGYKQSGIGRERSKHGLDEYLEIKALIGYNP
ncbi:MAG: aldehyde dehydrogenase family protein [Bacteriovoracaceae bacterium]|nr:aldehyde dehydrogenase family protein [Bacteriovoracaceae bacterium]